MHVETMAKKGKNKDLPNMKALRMKTMSNVVKI